MDISLSFSDMKVCCMFSFDSPHRGDSNEYTQYTLSIYERKSPEVIPDTIMSSAMVFKNEIEIAVINEPSRFELPKVYCISKKGEDANTI